MYIFSIPDAISIAYATKANARLVNWGMLEAKKQHPEWFFDDFIIETAYGAPCSCIWNGNRCVGENEEFDDGWLDTVAGMYKEYGVVYRLTFSNFLIKKKDLQDKSSNKLALALSKQGGYVTLSTNLMAEHLKKYRGLKICWSTTTDFGKTTEEKIEKINKLSEKNLVVLPYEFNNTPEIDRLLHPENIEVIINERCVDNCPYRRVHWREVNEIILMRDRLPEAKQNFGNCRFKKIFYNGEPRKHNVFREQLADYLAKGINHFKIAGRMEPDLMESSYKHYFVKPDFQTVYQDFQNDFFNNWTSAFERSHM